MNDNASPIAAAAEPANQAQEKFVYDAFFSYASTPDRDLVREVERFLEGLHAEPLVAQAYRRELEICVDGSDFKKPRRQAAAPAAQGEVDPLFSLIVEYMLRSRCLVVFVGPRTRDHYWLNAELAWWLAHRGPRDVHFVLAHGSDGAAAAWMPEPAIEAGFAGEIWFDFRAARRAASGSVSNRDYFEERLRLAAALMGSDVSAADLIQGWRVLRHEAHKRQMRRTVLVVAAIVLLAAGVGVAGFAAFDRAREAKVGLWTTLASAGSSQDPDRRLDALAYGAGALHALPTAASFRATAESLQILAQPLASLQVDRNKRALDSVAYVGDDQWLAVAGYDKVLRLYRRQGLQAAAAAALQGRAVSIVDRPVTNELIVVTRTGVDILGYTLDATPRLFLKGRLSVAPVQVDGLINRGATLAAAVDAPAGILYASATTGRVEWYRLAEAATTGWKPFRSVVLKDSNGLPLGIFGMAYVAKTRRLVAADASGEVVCLDVTRRKLPGKRFRHAADIFSMSVHQATGQVVAADSRGGWLSIDAAACAPSRIVEPPTPFGSVAINRLGALRSAPQVDAARTNVSFSGDGSLVSISGHDGTSRVVAAGSGAYVAMASHTAMTRASAFSRSKHELAVATADGRLVFWRIDRGAERMRIAEVDEAAVSGAHALAVGSGYATEIDLQSGALLASAKHALFEGMVHVVAARDEPGLYAVWQASRGQWAVVRSRRDAGSWQLEVVQRDAGIGERAQVMQIDSLPGGAWLLAVQGEVNQVIAVERSGDVRFKHRPRGLPQRLAVLPAHVVYADSEGEAVVLTHHGAEAFRLTGQKASEVVLGGGGDVFVIAGRNGARSHARVCVKGHAPPAVHPGWQCRPLDLPFTVLRAAVAPDGQAIAMSVKTSDTRPDSGALILARRKNDWRPAILTESGRVDALGFSGDSRHLAIGERRGLSLWNVDSMSATIALPTPSAVQRLAFSEPKGQVPVILSVDGIEPPVLRVWDMSAQAFIARACERWPRHRQPGAYAGVAPLPPRATICGE